MDDTKRSGRQTPTLAFTLPYTETNGAEAVELYNSTGLTSQEWQELLLYDILAVNGEGLWLHTKFGFAVSRRNGKNEVVLIREMYGLKHGEWILHTAHRTTTTHTAWERLLDRVERAGLKVVSSYRAYGKEHIELDTGGRIEFRTRTSKGGLGEGYDLLVIDEAQEYQDDQDAALKYVVSSSANPQTIYTGTPPTPTSAGTVFTKFRSDVLSGAKRNSGWAEWSVPTMTDPHDRAAWYATNPSLGTILTERKIEDEIGSDDAARIDFNIQRLGLWLLYNQRSAISKNEWSGAQLQALPELSGKMAIGIKYNVDGASVSLAIAVKTKDKRTLVEVVDCRDTKTGTKWIIDFLVKAKPATKKVVVDGANGQKIIAEAMKAARLPKPYFPTVKEIIMSNAAIEPMLAAGKLCHMGQPALAQSAANCEHRAIGSNGGFGYRSIKDGVDCSLLDSVILAAWALDNFKREAGGQKVNY